MDLMDLDDRSAVIVPARTLKVFACWMAVLAVLGMAYTAHRGFDWPEIAVISLGGSILLTFVWFRRFPN
jgi:hypothetical protein